MAKAKPNKSATAASDIWSKQNILEFAPDEASIPAAEKVLKKGGFGKVEATTDGKGWWVVCKGITDVYQTSVRIDEGTFACECTCPSPKYPCKHVLALLLYLYAHPELRVEAEAPKYAATDFEALLRAVFHNPDDDTPRLVFADFLEENNQPDRAALIRLQCEKARHKKGAPRFKELEKTEKPLVAKLQGQIGTLPEGMRATFERGFLRLTTELFALQEVAALPARFTSLFRDGWVEIVRFTGYFFFDELSDDYVGLFGFAGELDFSSANRSQNTLLSIATMTGAMRSTGRLHTVRVNKRDRKTLARLLEAQQGDMAGENTGGQVDERRYERLTLRTLDLLINSGRLRYVSRLFLVGGVGDAAAEQLAAADLTGVGALILDGWQLTPAGVAVLANSPALANITELELLGIRLEAAHIRALAGRSSPRQLQTLWLSDADMGDAALGELAKATRFSHLRRLNLNGNHFTAKGMAVFLRSPNFPALTDVVLGNDLDYPDILPLLLGAAEREELVLTFRGLTARRWCGKDGMRVGIDIPTQLRSDLFSGLAGVAAAKYVKALRLSRAQLTPPGLKAMAKAFDPATFKELEFREVAMKNEGASDFATAFKDCKLETLRLAFCGIQATGIAALAASPLLASVKVLDLSGNSIGKGGADALANSPYLGNIQKLELTGQRLGHHEKKTLKAKFGKKLEL
jgi:uncharacterized protein (TIGR02996 family)